MIIFSIRGKNFYFFSYIFCRDCPFGIKTISYIDMSKNIHFRRIPDHISRELNGIKAPFVVVSTTLRLSFDDIARGKYRSALPWVMAKSLTPPLWFLM